MVARWVALFRPRPSGGENPVVRPGVVGVWVPLDSLMG